MTDKGKIRLALAESQEIAATIAAEEPKNEFESQGNWQYYLRMIAAIEQKTSRTFAQLVTLRLIQMDKPGAREAGKIHFGF